MVRAPLIRSPSNGRTHWLLTGTMLSSRPIRLAREDLHATCSSHLPSYWEAPPPPPPPPRLPWWALNWLCKARTMGQVFPKDLKVGKATHATGQSCVTDRWNHCWALANNANSVRVQVQPGSVHYFALQGNGYFVSVEVGILSLFSMDSSGAMDHWFGLCQHNGINCARIQL